MSAVAVSYKPIEQVKREYLPNNSRPVSSLSDQVTSFSDMLRSKFPNYAGAGVSELTFSKHAARRLDERDIYLSDEQSQRLSAGVSKAGMKGINDSLVIVDSLAFIVNVPSQTVITAMDSIDTMDGNVFTNIDGAVIA